MAFIGGAGHFLGPIVGAIGLTYLDSTLADYTEAWPCFSIISKC